MLKFKKIELLTKTDKSVGNSEHGCCDHKTSRNMTCYAEKRENFYFFLGGFWLFALGESWDWEEEGEIREERVGRVGI
jgi:hypothetical protein